MLSRSESQALTLPIRESLLQLANYMQNVHGVRPENRDKTNPDEMPLASLRRWTVRYGLELRNDDGELFSEDELRVNAKERQYHPPGHDDDADLDTLQEGYDVLKAQRAEILDDTEDDEVATGPTQTVVPEALSVEMVQGMVNRG